MSAPVTAVLDAQSLRRPGRRWWLSDPVLLSALAVCVTLVIVAAIGPLLAPYDPYATDVLAASEPPSPAHPLGTDSLGRDILSRILFGARLSFLGPAIIVSISLTLGVTLAIASAWIGGRFDSGVNKVLNVLFAIPAVLVAVIAVAVFGTGFWAPVLALSVVFIPYVARVIRAAAMIERRKPYVEAMQLAGMTPLRITVVHILRNILPLVLAQATLMFGAALIDFGALSFVGLGVPQPIAEWGSMVNAGRSEVLSGSYEQTVAAGTVIVLSVVAFNVLGERITRRLGDGR